MPGIVHYMEKCGVKAVGRFDNSFSGFAKLKMKKGDVARVFHDNAWWEVTYEGDGNYSRKRLKNDE